MKTNQNQNLVNLEKLRKEEATLQTIDEKYNKKSYKKMRKQFVAEYCTSDKFDLLHKSINEYCIKIKQELASCKKLPHDDVKPNTDGMSKLEARLAYLPYNNGRRISEYTKAELISDLVSEKFTLKVYKSIVDRLLSLYIETLKTKNPGKFIINSISDYFADTFGLPIETGGQIVDIFASAGMFKVTKSNTKDGNKHKIFMISVKFEGIEDLYLKMRETSKDCARLSIGKPVDEDTFMISQAKWRYSQKKMPESQVKGVEKMNTTPYCFADYVTEETIEDAVYQLILPDTEYDNWKLTGEVSDEFSWTRVEVLMAIAEFNRIIENGNRFYINRFHDGVNRVYEHKSYFGFQTGKAMRKLLRFYNKKALSPVGVIELKKQLVALYDTDDVDTIMASHGDEWGYLHALQNPNEPTNVIVFQDGTTQGTGLYGICTGSELLLRQGGLWDIGDAPLVKAYSLLKETLNDELSMYYTIKNGKVTVIDCFTTENVKALHMTKLYNVGMERIMTGKSFSDFNSMDEDELDVTVDALQFNEEYQTEISKLGKLRPLLMTVREAGLDIDRDRLEQIFNKSIVKIAYSALKAMNIINSVSRGDKTTEIYEWTLPNGAKAQYAMVDSVETHIKWINTNGATHSFLHYVKKLVPGSKWRGLAPRIIQSLDAYLVSYVESHTSFDMATIHDSYGSHPNNAPIVRIAYKAGLIELYKWDPLTKIVSELVGRNVVSIQNQENKEEVLRNIQASKNGLLY